MKLLNILMLSTALLSTCLSADEIDSINLISPDSYNVSSSMAESIMSSTMTKFGSTFNVDIQNKVNDEINPHRDDLLNYFANRNEMNAFLNNIIQKGIRDNLTEVTEANLINFYQYLGNNLIAPIANKILDKEGITDPTRKSLWIRKMLIPFNICILNSKNPNYDANRCIGALTSSLIPNIGIGLVYELSRSKLSSTLPEKDRNSFNLEQVNLYTSCINKTESKASDIKECALAAMKTGVLKVTDLSLTKIVDEKSSSTKKATEIKELVWPAYKLCTQNVGSDSKSKVLYADQFKDCIDDLIQKTGSLLVTDKISNTASISAAFSAAEIRKLALDKSTQFKICAENQKKKGVYKDGILDVSPCENAVTNEVTYKVVVQSLKNTASETFNKNGALSVEVGNEGKKILDQCWKNNQTSPSREACLRKTILRFSDNVATLKLNDSIPAEMPTKADLIKKSKASLANCIEKELPKNISESNDLTSKLEGCSGDLTKNVAKTVAEYKIRDTAGENLNPEETNALVKSLVLEDFSKCIGEKPNEDRLEQCGNILTIKAAKNISDISFNKKVNDYLKDAGGLQALGITQIQIDDFLTNLNKTNKECIDKKTTGVVLDQVNSCIKQSINKIAFFFGDLQFNKNIGNMYNGRESDKKSIEAQFRKSLSECLSTKESKDFSIDDYTKNLYVCSDKVTHSMSLIIGEDQIDTSIGQYLKDRPGIDFKEKRDSIKAKLSGDFKTCMGSGTKQSTCIDNLKKSATRAIVINYGRIETKVQLNADQIPASLKPGEVDLEKCTDSQLEGDALTIHLEECTKDFALNFAKELGTLKLNYLLKQALGSDGFLAQKKEIDSSLKSYTECLDHLKSIKMTDGLTEKLTLCTDGLTNRGMNIVRSNINKWMTTEDKDAATIMIKQEFSNLLPCLSVLLPTSPYTQELQRNIESNVKPLAIYIADYIEYNPENAQRTLDGIIKKLSVDLNDVSATKQAKIDLLDFLLKNGSLDQFIKAIVRGTVRESLANTPKEDVSSELAEILLKKENYEEIFNSPEGARIKTMVMDKLLRPALVDGADMKGVSFQKNTDEIKNEVIKLLVNAPSFGEKIINFNVSANVKETSGFIKFFAKILYGADALNWDKVRLTPEGINAEKFIKESILTPKFSGVILSEAQLKLKMEEATKLIKRAVQLYGK